MHKESSDYMNHTDNGRPHPYIARQIARDGSPPAQQQVTGSDQERQPEESKCNVACGRG